MITDIYESFRSRLAIIKQSGNAQRRHEMMELMWTELFIDIAESLHAIAASNPGNTVSGELFSDMPTQVYELRNDGELKPSEMPAEFVESVTAPVHEPAVEVTAVAAKPAARRRSASQKLVMS